MGGFNWQQWADAFGYTNDADGISAVQHAYGLPETGVLDDMTVRVVTRLPRCGMTDAQPARGSISKWGIREISYHIVSYPPGIGLTTQQVDAVVSQAFAAWAAVVDLVFSKSDSADSANIVIGTGRGSRSNFDGPSGTLAWAQLPPSSSYKGQIQMMWDGDEAFTVSKTVNGILLLNVTTHEFGHALGLSHSNVPHSLMNPFYDPSIAAPQANDKQDVLTRYAPAKAPPTPVPTPSTPGSGSAPKAVKVQCEDGSVWAGTLARIA